MDAVRVIIAGRRATSPAQRRSVDRSLLGPSSLRSATTTGQKSCMTSFSGQDAFQRVSASSAQGGHPEAGAWSAEGLQSLLSFPQSSHIIESMWASETVSRTCTTRLQEYLPRSCDCKPDHKIAEAMWLCLDSLANPLPRKVEALVNECLSGWVDVVESQMHRASMPLSGRHPRRAWTTMGHRRGVSQLREPTRQPRRAVGSRRNMKMLWRASGMPMHLR